MECSPYNAKPMSQITRCPACKTSFRVVDDQLRISGGWVRCGRCKEIFDASAHLVIRRPQAGQEPTQTDGEKAAESAPAPQALHVPLAAPQPPQDNGADSAGPLRSVPGRPQVWGSARDGVAGFTSTSIDHLVRSSGPLPEAASAAEPPFSSPSSSPSAGGEPHAAPGAARLPASLATRNISYGLRKEANVVPPGWTPAPAPKAASAAAAPSAAGQAAREDPVFSDAMALESAPSAPTAPESKGEPADAPKPEPQTPLKTRPEADPVPDPDPDAGNDSGGVPELTFEASRFPLPVDEPAPGRAGGAPAPASPESAVGEEPGGDEVGFMRTARRKAFWSKPAVRIVLWLLALVLLVALAAQYALANRNHVAARYPQMRPLLEQLCKPLDCAVGLPRDIASVAIDSSTFTRAKDDPLAFRLQVALRNQAAIPLEMPVLELTLTDAEDRPVLRRVIGLEDSGAPAQLGAQGEWNGVIGLRVPEVADRVTGYRLLAFYP